MKHTFHKEYPAYIQRAKKDLNKLLYDYNNYVQDDLALHEGHYKVGHLYEGTIGYTQRIDRLRSEIMDYESDYNADAYGYCIQDPWTDDEYLDRIANGETIGGMML